MLTHRDGYRFHHLAVVDDVRPRRVDGHVVDLLCSPCRYLGHVFARDRLQTEITLAGDSEPRKSPQEPRDVVDQDVACAKDESWPDDRPGKTRLAHHLLGVGLAGVILEMGVLGRIAHRDVDDLAHPRVPRRAEQDPCVRDGIAKAALAVTEANPIRVVEPLSAPQALHQRRAICELQRDDVGSHVLRALSSGMVGEGLEGSFSSHEPAGDEPARVAECAGDYVEAQNGNRVRPYTAEPGCTCPVMTTRGRWRTASAGCTSGRSPLKIGKRSIPSGDHSE